MKSVIPQDHLAPNVRTLVATDAWRGQAVLNWALLLPALLLLTCFLVIPLAILLKNSFFPPDGDALSLLYFRKFLSDPYFLGILWRTMRLGLVAMLFTLLPGYVLAYNMTLNGSASWRGLVTVVILLPVVVNLVVRVFGWITVLSMDGVLNTILMSTGLIDSPLHILFTENAIVIGFVHSHLYFMVLSIAGTLMKIDPNLLRASENLGASPFKTFTNIVFPMSIPGVVSGCLLVFALNISDFVTPSLLGGSRSRMMTYLIYEQQLFMANQPFAAAATVILMVAAAIAVAGAMWVGSTQRSR